MIRLYRSILLRPGNVRRPDAWRDRRAVNDETADNSDVHETLLIAPRVVGGGSDGGQHYRRRRLRASSTLISFLTAE
jgi:hypothetical protein